MPPFAARPLTLALALAAAAAQPSASRTPTPTPSPSATPVPQIVSGTIRFVVASLPANYDISSCMFSLRAACILELGSALARLLPAPVYPPNSAEANSPFVSYLDASAAGAQYPGGAMGSTLMQLQVRLYQAPGGAPLRAAVASILAEGSPGAQAVVASIVRTTGQVCRGCDVLNASFAPASFSSNCFPPTCFPPGTQSFLPPAAPTPTPSPTPNVASATITMGSATVVVVGLPFATCAAAESACLQAVVGALAALLPPPAPAAKGGVSITSYFAGGGGTTFEASFAVLQAAGARVPVPATLRSGLAAGSAGEGALAASIAQATGSRADGLRVTVLSAQSADYSGAGAGGSGAGSGGVNSGGGGGGVTAGTIVLILLVVLQCVIFPACLLKCYLRHATVSLPPVLVSLFGLAPHAFNSLDEGAGAGAKAASAGSGGGGGGGGSGSNFPPAAAEAVAAAAPAGDVELVAVGPGRL
jgi:hypothetical protein